MPRGQKSKSRSRAKRHARNEGKSCSAVPSTAGEEAASPPGDQGDSHVSGSGDALLSQGLKTSESLDAGVTCTGSDAGVSRSASDADTTGASYDAGAACSGSDAGATGTGSDAGAACSGSDAGATGTGSGGGATGTGSDAGAACSGSDAGATGTGSDAGAACSGSDAGATGTGSDAGATGAGSDAGAYGTGSDAGAACSGSDAGASCSGSDEGAAGTGSMACAKNFVLPVGRKGSNVAKRVGSTFKDPIMKKASMLIELLLDKFKMKEPVTLSEMLIVVNKKYKGQFSAILQRTTARLELVFGLELKEIDPSTQTYILVGKLGLSTEGSLSSNWGLPRTGLLMIILGVIFMNGNRASEQEVWQFLSKVGVYAERKHLIFGEPREFIIRDLVKENYLEYHQVPSSVPPSFEFMWGSRAYAETTKMKVLEVLAKVIGTVPTAFPNLYRLALKDQAEGVRKKGSGRAGAVAKSQSKVKSSHIVHV